MSAPPADLNSPLAELIGAFLVHHRALGKRFDTEEASLRLLDRYLSDEGVASVQAITPAVLDAFLRSRPRRRPRSYNHLLSVVYRFFRWLERQQILAPIPLQSKPRRSAAQQAPFLLEPVEVERLLNLAGQLPDGPHAYGRGLTYRTIFALQYALGLRVGEVARLRRQDVDWERRCLVIRESKFAKSRLVPFGPRLGQQLRRHLGRDDHGPRSLEDPLFSLDRYGRRPIGAPSISRTFQRLVPQLGLTVPPGVAPPRLHSLRHSFAVAALLRWYHTGIDPATRLHYLSTFLGHVNPASTTVYLTITSDLLEQAGTRFERFAVQVLQEPLR
jgi:integrase